jgi:hypothetical protein
VKKIFSIAAVLAIFCFVSAGSAKADGEQVTYTITGPSTNPIDATFTMDVFPTVDADNAVVGEGFTILPTSITINGSNMAGDLITFYNAAGYGGLSDQDGLFSLENLGGATDAQMYTGSESAPQMTIYGSPVLLLDFVGEQDMYTVSVTTTPITTPEPAGLLLLATGIVALCLMRKFQTA